MRHTRLTLALAAVVAASAVGATMPSVALAASLDPGPPVAEQPAAAAAQLNLLVLPFAPMANADRDAWVGRAISEALTADLSIDRALSVSTDKDKPVDNANDALAAAKQAGAQAVVYGTFQTIDENVRVTGQVIDVETGKPLAGLKATGPLQELFSLQDSLVHQIQVRLGRPGLPQPPAQPAPGDSPLPLPEVKNDDGVLGVPLVPRQRGIPWLNDELARTDEFIRDQRIAHNDYVNNYPSPAYYYGPVWGFPVAGWGGGWGARWAGAGIGFPPGWGPVGAVPFAPGVAPPGWRPATPQYYPNDYYSPRYYYPPATVSVTTTDGDGWNGRAQTQGHGMVGGGMRATPKFQPYQLPGGTQYYQQTGALGAQPRSNVPVEAVTHQVGNRQMPISSHPVSPEVAARRAGTATPASVARSPGGVPRSAAPARPPVQTNQPSNSRQQQQQNSPSGQSARR